MGLFGDIVGVAKGVGDIAGAVGSVLGLVDSSDGGARDQMQWQQSFSREQLAQQREFAQQGVRWRVEDAKAAGIHPLYALGMQGPTYSPVQYIPGEIGESTADRFARHGQNLSRSMDSTRTAGERVDARMSALALERAELQNDLLRAQIAGLNQNATPPGPGSAYMIPGQTSSGVVKDTPLERVGPHALRTHQEPGAITDLGWARTATGLAPVPSKDVKERIEDSLVPELMWALRNQLMPNVDFTRSRRELKPPFEALPPGAMHWRWSFSRQEWQPHFPGRGEDVTGRTIRID